MTSRTTIRKPFAGQERLFRLGIGEITALEHACDAGLYAIAWRLNNHQARLADLREPIRLGLRGGGMTDEAATKLLLMEFDNAPTNEFFVLAVEILNATINGLPPKVESDGEGDAPEETPPAGLRGWHLIGFTMGLKPAEVDALTPAELVDLANQWKRMHPAPEDAELGVPTDAEAAAVREAVELYGS